MCVIFLEATPVEHAVLYLCMYHLISLDLYSLYLYLYTGDAIYVLV